MEKPIPTPAEQSGGIPRETRLTMIGIMLGMFLAALDQTIVSTALPKIVSDLKGTELYAWVTTTYLLTSTFSAPIFGRLTELYSRKSILIIAIAIFLGGSALCGLSQNMTQLIIFRGIQGVGGGALFALAFTTIAVLFPPRERGRVGGLFGAVFGVSSAIGPWLGGLLTDQLSWHWVFYINMPVGAVALWFILRFMPRLKPEHRETFDYLGAALLIGWTVPLMLAFSWGGSAYAWNSPRIVFLFALTVVLLALWIWSQLKNPHPLFDLSVLKIRSFSFAALAGFFFGPAFLGAVAFLPLYLQVVKGVSAAASGVTVLPLTIGVIVGAMGSGILSGRMGRYKPLLIVGTVWLLAVFLVLYFIISIETPLWLAVLFFLFLGLGLGPAQSLLQIAAQNDVPMQRIGSATSAIQFVRQIGATIGVAFMGTVLSLSLNKETCKVFPENASCQPGAVVKRSQEGAQATNIDEQFKKLEGQLVAALKGDTAAYQALITDPNLPEEQKRNLVEGGIPAQFAKTEETVIAALKGDTAAYQSLMADQNLPDEFKKNVVEGGIPAQVAAQNAKVLSDLELALKGNATAKQAILNNPNLDARVKATVQNPVPAAAIPGILAGIKQGLDAATPRIIENVEAKAIEGVKTNLAKARDEALVRVPQEVVSKLQEQKTKIKTALNNGITNAEKSIFLYGAGFVLLSLIFTLMLPNAELKGGGFGGRGGAKAQPAAH